MHSDGIRNIYDNGAVESAGKPVKRLQNCRRTVAIRQQKSNSRNRSIDDVLPDADWRRSVAQQGIDGWGVGIADYRLRHVVATRAQYRRPLRKSAPQG